MTSIDPQLWTKVQSTPIHGDRLTARNVDAIVAPSLYVAQDALNRRHVLVRIQSEQSGLEDRQSRGLIVSTREMTLQDGPAYRYIDVMCLEKSGHLAFDVVIADLLSLLPSTSDPAASVRQVLEKWRRFWSHPPKQFLTEEQQRGLFAELWFLLTWLSPQVGINESVRRWRGPFGARHDFEWWGRSVEVKSATTPQMSIIINGVEQLQPPDTGGLLLFAIALRSERGASNSLPVIVRACLAAMEHDSAAKSSFEDALARLGYSVEHEADYAENRLRIVDEGLFEVSGTFPRIIPSTFTNGVPPGIGNIAYSIDLTSAAGNKVTSVPTEWHGL